jgi:hypothetical protein
VRREGRGAGGKGRAAVREDARAVQRKTRDEPKPEPESEQSRQAQVRKKVIARLRRLHPMD